MLDVVDDDVVDKVDVGAKKTTRFGFHTMPPLVEQKFGPTSCRVGII